jgi:hypothetical protein
MMPRAFVVALPVVLVFDRAADDETDALLVTVFVELDAHRHVEPWVDRAPPTQLIDHLIEIEVVGRPPLRLTTAVVQT